MQFSVEMFSAVDKESTDLDCCAVPLRQMSFLLTFNTKSHKVSLYADHLIYRRLILVVSFQFITSRLIDN